jgi:hypothetical protein
MRHVLYIITGVCAFAILISLALVVQGAAQWIDANPNIGWFLATASAVVMFLGLCWWIGHDLLGQ